MRYASIFFASFMALSTPAYAGCIGPIISGECRGAYVDHDAVGSNVNNNSSYDSYSGTQYEYDLNNPSDSLQYSIDLEAKRRDSMNLSTSRDLDRGLGQYGGGAYDGY
jgi:hypothetical protein